jgi:FAD/FMN-containing dehydrogenase
MNLAARLSRAVEGEVLFDAGSRGRYATDASIYEVMPIGVLVPKTWDDVARGDCDLPRDARAGAAARGRQLAMRQTVGAALVDRSQQAPCRMRASIASAMTVTVEPGVVLDHAQRVAAPARLWFPVDVSTSAQATLGGMAGNNSCGSRSIAYGNMVHNVRAIDALLSDGTEARFGPAQRDGGAPPRDRRAAGRLRAIGERERARSSANVPKVLRRVGGYNIDVCTRRASGRTQPTAASTTPICWWAAKARWRWTRSSR